MCAEILGPEFGEHGSVLPAQKQFQTAHSHTETPHRVLNSNKPHSPANLGLKSVLESSVAPLEPVLAVRPDVDSGSKYSSSLLVSSCDPCVLKDETSKGRSGIPTAPRSLNLQIKVGLKKAANAICSGLGFLSPSSSMGNNPEDNDELPIESHDALLDSPSSILLEMTSSFVPENRLLSPLNENLLCLTRMGRIWESKHMSLILGRKDGLPSVLGEDKLMEGKEASSHEKSEILKGIINKNSTGNMGEEASFFCDSVHSTVGMLNAVTTAAANEPKDITDNWVMCDRCGKWRLLPDGIDIKDLPNEWMCNMLTWLPGMNHCDIKEDETTRMVEEINLHIVPQNQSSLPYKGSGVVSGLATAITVHSDHSNSNGNIETIVKISRKRKQSSTVTASRHDPKIIGNDVIEGDLKHKRLKSKAESDHFYPSNGDRRRMGMLAMSVKRRTEGTQQSMKSKSSDGKSSEEVEMRAKKRKLKDGPESQPSVNALESREETSDLIRRNGKRSKTANTEVKETPTVKGKAMKHILSGSKENSVGRSHVQNRQLDKHTQNITSRPKLYGSQRFLLSATSSSSKVSDSHRKPNEQERKGSLVESVSSLPAAGKPIIRKKRVEADIACVGRQKYSNDSNAKVIRRLGDGIGDEKLIKEKLPYVGRLKAIPTVKKDLRNANAVKISNKTDGSPCSVAKKSNLAHLHHPLSRSLELTNSDESGRNVSKALKSIRDATNQDVKNRATGCGTGAMKDLGVLSFTKQYASSQTAMTAFRRAKESKDHADCIKISDLGYDSKDAYFDSALKFLHVASLLEACSTDVSKSGLDPVNVYSTAAKLFKTCAQEYEKEKEMAAATLAYKCMEVVYMRIVYCKSSIARQDLQTSLRMVNRCSGGSASSASDVDNQATMDKSFAPPGNHVVALNQATVRRILDFNSEVLVAMEASQNAYAAAASAISENKELMISIKRVVGLSFQNIKEVVHLVQYARAAIYLRSFKE